MNKTNSMAYGTQSFKEALTSALQIIPILSRINSIHRNDMYFFKISNISHPIYAKGFLEVSTDLSFKMLKALLSSILTMYLDYISWTIQTMKFLMSR
jgi:hypothetical protein